MMQPLQCQCQINWKCTSDESGSSEWCQPTQQNTTQTEHSTQTWQASWWQTRTMAESADTFCIKASLQSCSGRIFLQISWPPWEAAEKDSWKCMLAGELLVKSSPATLAPSMYQRNEDSNGSRKMIIASFLGGFNLPYLISSTALFLACRALFVLTSKTEIH